MTDTTSNDLQAVIGIARQSTIPQEVEPGGIWVVQGAGGVQTVDLTGDKYRGYPRRKQGAVTVRDVASFAQYHTKHSDDSTEVYADTDNATITAVLDAHHGSEDPAGDARWQDHRLTLRLRNTPEWDTWTGSDRRMMSQEAFAEFIEDNVADIHADSPVTAADLLEMAQQFQAHTKVTFSSGKRIATGETQLVYTEQVDAKAGDRGTIEIPAAFGVRLAPFDDVPRQLVRARFRYRLREGTVTMAYHLDQPDRIFRDAVSQVVELVEHACATTVMRGTP